MEERLCRSTWIDAGYNWPQYAVHRELHMLLYRTLIDVLEKICGVRCQS